MNLAALVNEALAVSADDFDDLVQKVKVLLGKESGQIGNFSVNNRLVTLEPLGEAVVIGDLHGDLESLSLILERSQFLEKMQQSKDATLIFLGDYGDRGANSAEVYYVVLKLKLAFPEQVVLLRGNHEAPRNLIGSPHDLPLQFQRRFGEGWERVYEGMWALFACFYNAVYVEERYLMVHGGVSDKTVSLRDIAHAQEGGGEAVLEDLLWSDPVDNLRGVSFSPRGAGKLFGKDVTQRILEALNVKVLIRGHQSSDVGFKINHDGKVLTLFSRKGAPYYNDYGAYLQLPLARKISDANQLAAYIKKF